MKVIVPISVSAAALTSSTVPEADYPAYSSGTTYAAEDRVISTATHRIYESAIAGNIGHDPTTGASQWIDVGPTNRWAMFDAAAGPATSSATAIVVAISLDDAVNGIGLVDLQAASVRLRLTSGATVLLDVTHASPAATDLFLNLPAGTGRTATVTINPTGGTAIVGKLITGTTLDLGVTEDAPTISLLDFSKRDTDAFGVTTVVERSWAKRTTARSRLDSSAVDNVQRRLALVRAVPLLWVGDDAFPALSGYGFYKDFSVDLQLGATSFCSLTFEGLPSATIAVPVTDPAIKPPSNFLAVRPQIVTDAILTATNVLENDHPLWSNLTSYAEGARVISTTTHRIYESLSAANSGNDPTTDITHWLDVGPTNRWAMFDQALGSVTERAGSITLTLTPSAAVAALAVLDTAAASVRVQSTGYDKTKTLPLVDGSGVNFLDLAVPAGQPIMITVTAVSGGDLASIGTLLIGSIEPFGITETSPNVSTTDFSLKNTDDFGSTTAIERAWSKRMAVKSLISTSAVDNVMRRVATLRAIPTLWIGDQQFDSLSIYGFFRDFSIQMSERTSVIGVTVEGLGKAAPAADPSADIRRLEALIAAIGSSGVLSAGARKRDIIIQWNALSNQWLALDAKFADLGSPSDIAAAHLAAGNAIFALNLYLTGLTPAWDDPTTDTPIDAVTWSADWDAAYETVADLNAAITGRPATVAISSSAQQFKFGAGGAPIGQTISFHAQRQNTTLATVFTIYDSAGTSLTSGSAATIAATGYFTRIDDDTITMTSSQFVSFTTGAPERETFTVRATLTGTSLFGETSVSKVIDGATGSNGYSNSLVYLFKRATSTPAVPAATLTFTFATGVLAGGSLAGWTQTPPAGTDPLYVTAASANSIGATDTIASGEWSSPVVLAEDGATGPAGLNTATVFLYKRATSTPAVPASTLTYTFASSVLSGTLSGWTQSVPGGTDPIYVTTATAASTGPTDTIATGEWAAPNILAQNGVDGQNGYSNALVYLFKRAASTPAVPAATLTYTFATDALTGTLSGWTRTPPAPDGNPLYVTVATASSNGASDTIATGEWSSPVVQAQDGGTGTNGLNVATAFLYKRATSAPAVPASTLTFTFATGALSGTLSGWTQSLPSGTDPVYYTTATAVATGATDTIATGEWATPQILAQNGTDGSPGVSALNLSALPNPITVACTSNGTPKAAVPGFTITATQAGADVTGSLTYGTETVVGLSGYSRTGASVSVTGMTADTGSVTIPVSNAGANASITVTYTKAKDGSAAVSDTTTIGAPLSASYVECARLTLTMGPNGDIQVDVDCSYDHSGGGTLHVDGYAEYSLNGGSTFVSGTAHTGNLASATLGSGDLSFSQTWNGATIGLTVRQSVVVRVMARNNSSIASFGGSMTVSWI